MIPTMSCTSTAGTAATTPGGWADITVLHGLSAGAGTGIAPGITADGTGAGDGTIPGTDPAGTTRSGDLAGMILSGDPAGTIRSGMADGALGGLGITDGTIPGTVLSIPAAVEYGVTYITDLAQAPTP